MLVKYKYRASTGVFGWFQCDDVDFKQFFKSRRSSCLYWVVVRRGLEVWIWSRGVGWYKLDSEPWWCTAP